MSSVQKPLTPQGYIYQPGRIVLLLSIVELCWVTYFNQPTGLPFQTISGRRREGNGRKKPGVTGGIGGVCSTLGGDTRSLQEQRGGPAGETGGERSRDQPRQRHNPKASGPVPRPPREGETEERGHQAAGDLLALLNWCLGQSGVSLAYPRQVESAA